MKRVLIFILMFSSFALSAQSEKSKVITDSINSEILGCIREFNVYLPHNYNVDKEKTYPVLYLLHGYSDDNTKWTARGHVRDVMNNLVRSGQVDEMIVIMPMAGIVKGETDTYHGYFNVPGWKYEDFFFNEFMPQVESRYRIKGGKENRAIAGLSMGGGGATSYGQKHPELFCAVYAMSALMDNAPERQPKPGDDPKKIIMWNSAIENSCIAFVRDASDETVHKLKTVKWFVDCGDEDFLLSVNLDFVSAMMAKGIPFELRVRDGIHDWEYWHTSLSTCLPFMNRTFAN